MKLFNTLSGKIEEFVPQDKKEVTFYTCGPTVYQSPTIGNWRTYVFADVLKRALEYFDYPVKHIMNFTDVGHLTSDADTGEDKLAKSAKLERKTAWQIAEKYIGEFIQEAKTLNLISPIKYTRATDYIKNQINLIKTLELKGLVYQTKDGVYFDTAKLTDYGKLFRLDKEGLKAGARVEVNPEKKNITDFALWKFSPKDVRRDMEWPSPWGTGFPGWHIECSAMILAELSETIDIHIGGVDLAPIHHNNEIAQSESATGKPLARYWLHSEFLLVGRRRMGKSLGNAYTINDIIQKGYNPLDLRYFFFSAHYRSKLNFTWPALAGAKKNLRALRSVNKLQDKNFQPLAKKEIKGPAAEILLKFEQALGNNLNLPKAIAALNDLSSLPKSKEKLSVFYYFDRVLGLDLLKQEADDQTIPEKILELKSQRDQARQNRDWDKADEIRQQIESAGYQVEDRQDGSIIKKL